MELNWENVMIQVIFSLINSAIGIWIGYQVGKARYAPINFMEINKGV